MPNVSSRRDFLKAAGAGLAATAAGHAQTAPAQGPNSKAQLTNGAVSVSFDLATGRLQVHRESQLLVDALPRAVLRDGVRSAGEAAYTRSVRRVAIRDPLGSGRQLVATCKDGDGRLDFELRAALYQGRDDAVVLEVLCRNASSRELNLRRLEPISPAGEAEASCYWPHVEKVLTNGKMYYDAGHVKDLQRPAESWWNVGLYGGDRQPGLVVGYLDNHAGLGRVYVRRTAPGLGSQTGALALRAESRYPDEFVLLPGQTVSSNRVIINSAADPFTALESYAQAIGDFHEVRLNPPINGWCSWFSFFGDITEREVIRQAEFAARHLKGHGLKYIQVDDGFYRAFGDWEGNAKFPHGMKWLARRIREIGLEPGIWLAPYCIGRGTEVYEQHEDWLVHNSDGTLMACGPSLRADSPEAKEARPGICCLDITHPDAARWMHDLFDRAANDWGYDFIKIDFVDWTILSAKRYHDPTATQASVYRRGCDIMRKAMGPNRHLLDCGPGPVSVGLIDSMRIELDQPPVTWQQYFLHAASSAPAAAKRYYYHNRTWINDNDHVVLAWLTMSQAQAAATVVALSGGNMISGDRMTDLDVGRLEILKKVLPSYGQSARPVDLFDAERPSIFALDVKRPFGEWLVVGVFNCDERNHIEKNIPLERLRLDPAKRYVAFDFWKQRFHGELRGSLDVRVEPASVILLAIHERTGEPRIISTDRHFTQGGVELGEVRWNSGSTTLRAVSLGPPGSRHNTYIYLPEPHPWVQADPFSFYDHPGYTLKVVEPHILRVQARFDERGSVDWAVNFKEFFAKESRTQ